MYKRYGKHVRDIAATSEALATNSIGLRASKEENDSHATKSALAVGVSLVGRMGGVLAASRKWAWYDPLQSSNDHAYLVVGIVSITAFISQIAHPYNKEKKYDSRRNTSVGGMGGGGGILCSDESPKSQVCLARSSKKNKNSLSQITPRITTSVGTDSHTNRETARITHGM